MTRIVDTSVVVKWVVREPDSDEALALLGEDIVAPDLLQAELANALWKKVQRKQIEAMQAIAGFEEVAANLSFVPSSGLARAALAIGLELEHPVYDCHFLALADMLDVPIVTADVRFIRRSANTRFASLLEPLTSSKRSLGEQR